jgi:hypothetical protein
MSNNQEATTGGTPADGLDVARTTRHPGAPTGPRDVAIRLLVLLGLLGVPVLMIAFARPWTFEHVGPLMTDTTAGGRAFLGFVVGGALAAPTVLVSLPRVGRLLKVPVVVWLVLAAQYLIWSWIWLKGGGEDWSARYFRSEADWYIVTSILGFLVLGFLLGAVVHPIVKRVRARRVARIVPAPA